MEINIIAVILSFLINLLKRYSSKISSFILSKVYKSETNEILELNNEIKALKKERDSFNQIEEFARYALVDRKINKILDKIKDIRGKINAEKMAKIMYFNVFFTVLILLASVTLIWWNYNTPIIDFNPTSAHQDGQSTYLNENIFFPLDKFLSFPCTQRKNSIGVTAWLFIVNRFIDISINKLNNFLLKK